jgi:hypothetical protein
MVYHSMLIRARSFILEFGIDTLWIRESPAGNESSGWTIHCKKVVFQNPLDREEQIFI